MLSKNDNLTVTEYISNQLALEQEAKELMPWTPKKCTYNMGPIRQQIFACRTHNNIGICYSCSILCHTSCDIVELFTKRHFTCDCGTDRDNRVEGHDQIRCELRKNRSDDVSASDNIYNQNFQGLFCSCSKEYDPDSPAVMLQCILGLECDEDWYHDYCIMGKKNKEVIRRKSEEDQEVLEEAPDGFPDLESFDSFICWKCISKYAYYFDKLLSHEVAEKLFTQKLFHGDPNINVQKDIKDNSKKRDFNEMDNSQTCKYYSLFLKKDYSKTLKSLKESIKDKDEKLYIFLDRIVPFLIDDDPIYEPCEEEEEKNEIDIFQLTKDFLQASQNRDQVAKNIVAFHNLKSKLNNFLKSFADTGKVVKEDDIRSFFEQSS